MTDKVDFSKSFLNFRILQAAQDFMNLEKCIAVPIVKGQCPGIWSVVISKFPPPALHQDNVPVNFTLNMKKNASTCQSGVVPTFHLACMVQLICDEGIIGFVAHRQIETLIKNSEKAREMDSAHFLVGAEYSIVHRTGRLFLYHDLYDVIKKFNV